MSTSKLPRLMKFGMLKEGQKDECTISFIFFLPPAQIIVAEFKEMIGN